MRCPTCNDRVARVKVDGVLITGRQILIKSDSLVLLCRRCRTEIEVRNPTLLKVKPSAD